MHGVLDNFADFFSSSHYSPVSLLVLLDLKTFSVVGYVSGQLTFKEHNGIFVDCRGVSI